MYPGLTDTDCRATESRFHQLRVEADTRRFVRDHAVAADGAGFVAHLSQVLSLSRRFLNMKRAGRTRGSSWRMPVVPSRFK